MTEFHSPARHSLASHPAAKPKTHLENFLARPLRGTQIIDFCGDRYLIDALATDGTSITFVKTSLRVPKLGEPLPEFSLTTLDGQTLESKSLRKKIHLLDFWASWCKPCVEKFGLMKQMANDFKTEVSVIAINVDEEPELPAAREVIKNYVQPGRT